MKNVTVTLRSDDAEPILFKAAFDAAKFGSYCDYITRRTGNTPSGDPETWKKNFLAAKRTVEAFGIEYEQVSEQETITIAFNYVGGKRKVVNMPGIGPVGWRTGSEPDYKNPYPNFYSMVHGHACEAAARRTVRSWKALSSQAQAA